MSKKFLTVLLGMALIFGVMMPVTAAEVDLQWDVLGPEFSVRGEQGPFLAEVPFAEKNWGHDGLDHPVWGLSGFNLGLKGPELSPFYAKLQFNWGRKDTSYKFDGLEIGAGGIYDLWNYTSFGAEVSLKNPSIQQIESKDWSLEIFVKYNFDNFLGLSEPEHST